MGYIWERACLLRRLGRGCRILGAVATCIVNLLLPECACESSNSCSKLGRVARSLLIFLSVCGERQDCGCDRWRTASKQGGCWLLGAAAANHGSAAQWPSKGRAHPLSSKYTHASGLTLLTHVYTTLWTNREELALLSNQSPFSLLIRVEALCTLMYHKFHVAVHRKAGAECKCDI